MIIVRMRGGAMLPVKLCYDPAGDGGLFPLCEKKYTYFNNTLGKHKPVCSSIVSTVPMWFKKSKKRSRPRGRPLQKKRKLVYCPTTALTVWVVSFT